jgi:glycosyltransferase involved in cell wall biosynthesis
MTAPRVTVGIPFFDEQDFLGAAIRSVLAQTTDDFELLLVDDGSTDRSLEIARSVADPRVVVRSDGLRKHLPARLNEIARAARGELVLRRDADDVSHPERLARFDAVPRCDGVGTWAALIDDAEEPFAVVEIRRSPRLARAGARAREPRPRDAARAVRLPPREPLRRDAHPRGGPRPLVPNRRDVDVRGRPRTAVRRAGLAPPPRLRP